MAVSLPDLQEVEKVNYSSPSLHKKELWLISLPTEVSLGSLEGHTITEGTSNNINISSDSYNVQISKGQTNVIPIVSGPKSGKLSFGSLCKGEMVLVRSLPNISGQEEQKTPVGHTREEIDLSQLKQRWKPFGWKTPQYSRQNNKVTKMKHKKKKRKD